MITRVTYLIIPVIAICRSISPATVLSAVCAQLVNPGATVVTLSPWVNRTVCATARPLQHTATDNPRHSR